MSSEEREPITDAEAARLEAEARFEAQVIQAAINHSNDNPDYLDKTIEEEKSHK